MEDCGTNSDNCRENSSDKSVSILGLFCWMSPIFKKGHSADLFTENLLKYRTNLPHIRTEPVYLKLQREWSRLYSRRAERERHFLLTSLIRAFWPLHLSKLSLPYLISEMARRVESPHSPSSYSLPLLAVGFCFLMLLDMVTYSHGYFLSLCAANQMKSATSILIYQKMLKINSATFSQFESGKITNFLSSDVEKFQSGIKHLVTVWLGPVLMVMVLTLLCLEVQTASLPAIGFLLIILALEIYSSQKVGKWRYKIAAWTDKRVQAMTEMISGINVIKIHCWQNHFIHLVKLLRGLEMKRINRLCTLKGQTNGLFLPLSKVINLLIIITLFSIAGSLDVPKLTKIIGLTEILKISINPNGLHYLFELYSSIKRIQHFLLTSERGQPGYKGHNRHMALACCESIDSLCNDSLTPRQKPSSSEQRVGNILVGHNDGQDSVISSWIQSVTNQSVFLLTAADVNALWKHEGVALSSLEEDVDEEKSDQKPPSEINWKFALRETPDGADADCCGSPSGEGSQQSVSDLQCVYPIVLERIVASWYAKPDKYIKNQGSPQESYPQHQHSFKLNDINIRIKKGSLVAVVGPVGSGKTSLLLAMMNELHISQGKHHINGRVSYAPQKAWIHPASIRDNITMGKHFDQQLYNRTIRSTVLNQDIMSQSDGDNTLLGDRGLTLSGGQKARINLARALYHDGDIYVLDDTLAALDVTVANHIFHSCFKDHLGDKTRIFVTHHLHLLDKVDQILILQNGRIVAMGSYNEVKGQLRKLHRYMSVMSNKVFHHVSLRKPAKEKTSIYSSPLPEDVKVFCNNAVAEEDNCFISRGVVSLETYKEYLFGKKHKFVFLMFFISLLIMVILYLSSELWLINWLQDRQKSQHEDINSAATVLNIGVYGAFVATIVFLSGLQTMLFFLSQSKSSEELHNAMLAKLIGAPSSFFDTNSLGKLVDRFSKDTAKMDMSLPLHIHSAFVEGVMFIGVLILSSITMPWSSLITLPVIALLVWLRQYASKTITQVRRIEALCLSPLLTHVSSTAAGLVSIRALQVAPLVSRQFEELVERQSVAWMVLLCANQWFILRVDLLVLLICVGCVVCALALPQNTLTGGVFGIVMSHFIPIISMLRHLVKESALLDSQMTCVERIHNYGNIIMESPIKQPTLEIDYDWPTFGAIVFDHVTLRYNKRPAVLKNISFSARSQDKIGVVGRTGAGKSSLATALLRLAEPEGHIWIDGVDVTQISLTDLRSKISVIPQDPFLFTGTIRRNLDPSFQNTEDQLWTALEKVQLKSKVKHLPGGLSTEVGEAGSNLSLGQRQLICLARAILRNNKIVIIDEATANVDLRTDSLIQRCIKEEFKSCTVLAISHRLYTIIEMDKIMVIDDGRICQYGHPYKLLNEKGIFQKMVEATSNNERRLLKYLAKKAFVKLVSNEVAV